jgi:hypothetical protein
MREVTKKVSQQCEWEAMEKNIAWTFHITARMANHCAVSVTGEKQIMQESTHAETVPSTLWASISLENLKVL